MSTAVYTLLVEHYFSETEKCFPRTEPKEVFLCCCLFVFNLDLVAGTDSGGNAREVVASSEDQP